MDIVQGPERGPKPDTFQVWVIEPGDSLPYTLGLIQGDQKGSSTVVPYPGFDPYYAAIDFRFCGDRPPDEDCGAISCRPAPGGGPSVAIDYLAKDYTSFRRLLLGRLSQTVPGWTDRSVPDLGLTLVEAMAYVADHLSYFQDAVATEAYLGTARRRVSVRRHVRLVDYPMHEGCNARTWVCLKVKGEVALDPEDVYFFTDPVLRPGQDAPPPVLRADDLLQDSQASRVVFAPMTPRPPGRQTPGSDRSCVCGNEPRPAPIRLFPEHNVIRFHTEAGTDACLPRGATAATLCGPLPHLHPGDVLIFEEVKGPRTGQEADADPSRRHAVRLTQVAGGQDRLVEVEWFEEDALPFPLCLAWHGQVDVSVARGNVVLVDQGVWQRENKPLQAIEPEPEPPSGCSNTSADGGDQPASPPQHPPTRSDGRRVAWRYKPLATRPLTHAAPFPDPEVLARVQAGYLAEYLDWLRRHRRGRARIKRVARLLRLVLAGSPLVHWGIVCELRAMLEDTPTAGGEGSHPLLPWAGQAPSLEGEHGEEIDPLNPLAYGPAREALAQKPQDALPAVLLRSTQRHCRWAPRRDLLGQPGEAHTLVAEIDDEGLAHLRFDDDTPGRTPLPGEVVDVCCRAGNGSAGNVGARTITGWVGIKHSLEGIDCVFNPLPAAGGADPEPVEAVKLMAPTAYRDRPRRAITADDYALLAGRDPRVQKAVAVLLWTGSGFEARVSLDLLDETVARYGARVGRVYEEVQAFLERYRRIGHDVRVVPARMVPVDIKVEVHLDPQALAVPVKAALRSRLGRGVLPDGRLGLLHPDNLTFGKPLAESALVEAAQTVVGVKWVKVKVLRRFFGPDSPPTPPGGILTVGPLEILQFDDDAGAPTRGRLTINTKGGR
jgi:hypothetical protein